MTFFPDLAPYRYGFAPAAWGPDGPSSLEPTDLYTWMWGPEDGAFEVPELTVGWLEPPHEFPRGELSAPLVQKLERLCRASRYHLTRGFHPCGICGDSADGLGSKEIRLEGDGVVYAAPNKVAHYVAEHAYLPPEGFVAALERCNGLAQPRPGTVRPVTIDMIPRETVDVSVLDAEVRASLQRDHREQLFRDLSFHERGDIVVIFTRIAVQGGSEPFPRSWDVPKRALLNMTQAVHGITGLLEATNTELALAFIEQWRRSRGTPS